ncbi:DUF4426 domain-containing protein [Shewanella sp. SR43-4]|jgi:hypothetical protein|uniref:DUF4426 domain-containing protein n=2 Tax=Shewanellaceae TaxID=267890 RepID=A0ABV0FS31_9GAMM|nr:MULTISPECIES: DUF4426 domain-containing protein [Shewanella]MBB1318771.1 DUF4426 domain-containing protein [Shewanella sp. SR43-4]MBB1389949.1 DUF4426 domain-containing protein [Shewanella sp. SG44-6]MBB1474316.1 DUF4426 domain-containing protein [Shewanella sp. SG41-3]UJL42897.1 DUF4426 domain-containing protein [Shewanella vesiculosa]|tara:strand:- start:158 stop:613 length:456 start_codon:yes stop_codon:yes gene_type:complete
MFQSLRLSRSLLPILLLSLMAMTSTAQAEQKQQVGNFDIHYMALNSTFITPEIAKTYGIERSSYNGLVNITVLNTSQDGHPAVPVEISGIANNLLDARITLDFKEIREGNSIYYIAEVPYRDDQEVNFTIAIKYGKQLNTSLKFKQKFYVD